MNWAVVKVVWCGLFVYVLLGGIKYSQFTSMMAAQAQFQMPPEAVTVTEIKSQAWPDIVEVTGDVLPLNGALLKAEETGRVARVAQISGTMVAAGTVLVELESGAEAGELKAAEAKAKLAEIQLGRARTMRASNLNALVDLNRAEAEHAEALGQVAAWQGRLRLKQVVAPFAGTVGVIRVQEGEFVERGAAIVQVDDDTTLRVRFSFPDNVPVKIGDKIEIESDAAVGKVISASVDVVDPAADMMNRQMLGEARVQKSEVPLKSGGFVRVRLISSAERNLWSVPAAGIAYAPYGNSIFIVEAKPGADGKETLTVRQQFIDIVTRRGDFVGARGDLKEGERVVNAGAFKLRPGGAVIIRSDIVPVNELNPKPGNS